MSYNTKQNELVYQGSTPHTGHVKFMILRWFFLLTTRYRRIWWDLIWVGSRTWSEPKSRPDTSGQRFQKSQLYTRYLNWMHHHLCMHIPWICQVYTCIWLVCSCQMMRLAYQSYDVSTPCTWWVYTSCLMSLYPACIWRVYTCHETSLSQCCIWEVYTRQKKHRLSTGEESWEPFPPITRMKATDFKAIT